MSFGHSHYVPCLRWKQGEYKALSLVGDPTREMVTPLIEVPEKGFDFETWTDKKSIDEHLEPFAKRLKKYWQRRRCFVDLKHILSTERVRGGLHPVGFVFDQLRVQGCHAIPVTAISRDAQYHQAVIQSVAKDNRGLCVRVTIEEAVDPGLKSSINALLGRAVPAEDCDLILDLEAPNFLPLEGFAKVVEAIIKGLPKLDAWRTFTLIGTSFPAHMGEIKTDQATIPRNEWLLYKLLVPVLAKARIRIPAFGDYAINHPEVIQKDMRKLKPGGTVRYATDDAWLIVKGPNVRDNGFGQYVGHCKKVITSSYYLGANFSEGDQYISDCARGDASTGNLSTWRWVGTNHHLEKVARDVASFYAV